MTSLEAIRDLKLQLRMVLPPGEYKGFNNGKESWIMIRNPPKNTSRHQNLTISPWAKEIPPKPVDHNPGTHATMPTAGLRATKMSKPGDTML